MKLHLRQVRQEEQGLVAHLLGGAAAHLQKQGRPLWSANEVSEAAVEAHVRAGLYHAAFDAEVPVGVFRFQLEDPHFWPEIASGTSAFIHKVAVHPDRQGQALSQVLLRHACELTRQCERKFLRLDCEGGRPGLRAMYERFGFRHHSDKILGGQVFHRFELEVEGTDG